MNTFNKLNEDEENLNTKGELADDDVDTVAGGVAGMRPLPAGTTCPTPGCKYVKKYEDDGNLTCLHRPTGPRGEHRAPPCPLDCVHKDNDCCSLSGIHGSIL